MFSRNRLSIFLLLTALILGAFFRFYKLGVAPIGFYSDEAALGYNAYSILKTGKDEYGKPFPVLFRSFETFQSPVYTYLTVPFVYFFGLTPFSVRLPSALLGFLTLPLIYFLIKQFHLPSTIYHLPSLTTLFLAVSPWHILYSRTAYEANVALFFLVLGLVFFLCSFQKPLQLIPAGISLAISILAYRAEILIVPLLLPFLLYLLFREPSRCHKKYYVSCIASIGLGLIIIFPLLTIINTPGFNARSAELNINFSLKEFISLYSSYFSPRYLFSIGDSGPRSSFPNFGTFFQWQLPLYLFGLYMLIKSKNNLLLKTIILTLLFVSPLPAALTKDPYTTIRSLTMVVPLTVIMAYGFDRVIGNFSYNKYRYLYFVSGLVILYSIAKLYISIFYFNDYFRSRYWDMGWKQVANDIKKLDPKLPIIVDTARGEPYIHLLFHLQYNPAIYQKENTNLNLSEYYTNIKRNKNARMGNITLKSFQWGVDTDRIEKYLIVDNLAISQAQIDYHKLTVINEIKSLDGAIVFRILKTNPTQ